MNHHHPNAFYPGGGAPFGEPSIPASEFEKRLFTIAILARLIIVIIFNLTDAIYKLRLSPDSERYHRGAMLVLEDIERGMFPWDKLIDQAWYVITACIYIVFGASPVAIQLFNVIISSITAIIAFRMVCELLGDGFAARLTGLFVGLFPSFVYWSCLMLKDPLSIFAVCLMVLSVLKLKQQFTVRWILGAVFGALIVLGLREYLFFISILLIVASLYPLGKNPKASFVRFAVVGLIIGTVPYFLGFGFFGLRAMENSVYFDLDYINTVRVGMGDHGHGAMFTGENVPIWGEDMLQNLYLASKPIFYFFVSLDLHNIGSVRQLMAIPETLIFIALLRYLFRGGMYLAKNHLYLAWPLFLFALGLMAVYSSATTNKGALFRWRMQTMPFFMTFISAGLMVAGKGVIWNICCRMLAALKLYDGSSSGPQVGPPNELPPPPTHQPPGYGPQAWHRLPPGSFPAPQRDRPPRGHH